MTRVIATLALLALLAVVTVSAEGESEHLDSRTRLQPIGWRFKLPYADRYNLAKIGQNGKLRWDPMPTLPPRKTIVPPTGSPSPQGPPFGLNAPSPTKSD